MAITKENTITTHGLTSKTWTESARTESGQSRGSLVQVNIMIIGHLLSRTQERGDWWKAGITEIREAEHMSKL